MSYRISFIIIFIINLTNSTAFGTNSIVINEILASNTHTHLDPYTKNFVDCIEFYNLSDSLINLQGMYLSDKIDNPFKWEFQEPFNIPPKGYNVIYANDNDHHYSTNFKLSKSGETLGLYSKSGEIINIITFPKQVTDHSYGRYPDGSESFFYFGEPSIGSKNNSDTTSYIVQLIQPSFSGGFGLWDKISNLSLSAQQNETIHYTLDGSIPTSSSIVYTQPIEINQTTVVKARAYRAGYLPSKTCQQPPFLRQT